MTYFEERLNSHYIQQFRFWFLALIAVAKTVRYTIQYQVQVVQAIGWGYLADMQRHDYHFVTAFDSFFSTGNQGGTAGKNLMALAQSVNIFGLTEYTSWEIYISIIFNVILYFIIMRFLKTHDKITQRDMYFIYFNVIILNLFCFCLAKEVLQMIFWLITMHFIRKAEDQAKGVLAVSFALFLTVVFTRKYYILVLIYFLILYFYIVKFYPNMDLRTRRGNYRMYASIIVMLILMTGIYYVMSVYLSIEDEDTFEELQRVNTRDSAGANSILLPVFGKGGGAVIMSLEFFLKVLRLMFPIELLMRFKPTYAITIVYQAMVFAIIVRSLKTDKTNLLDKRLATYVYLAFWLTSATFEPDFGSWMRHQGVIFPVLMYTLGERVEDNKEENEETIENSTGDLLLPA